MFTIILVLVSMVFVILAYKGRNILLSIAGGGILYGLYWQLTQSYPTFMVSPVNSIIFLSFLAVIIFTLFRCVHDENGWHFSLSKEHNSQHIYSHNGDNKVYRPNISTMEGRQLIYKAQIHSKLNQSSEKRR